MDDDVIVLLFQQVMFRITRFFAIIMLGNQMMQVTV